MTAPTPPPEPIWTLLLPAVLAYAVACGGWMLLDRVLRPGWWPRPEPPRSARRWLDLALVLVAAVAILGLGQLWRAGWLLPSREGWVGDLLWTANNLVIYSPMFLVLAARRQTTETLYLSPRNLPVKLGAGLVLGLAAVAVYAVLRGEPARIFTVVAEALRRESLRNFVPVFLEGVAVAFIFVRLRWAVGEWPALVAPGVLFAAAHIPRQLDSGLPAAEMAAYFAVTWLVTLVVLWTLQRSRDVVWLGLVHYLMDVAIGAFD